MGPECQGGNQLETFRHTTWTKFATYARTEHNGDLDAAMEQLLFNNKIVVRLLDTGRII